jgi:UDP-2,4-diacetamido-2,4,6-trideoxy-beta-L-altropyranose hydrolase
MGTGHVMRCLALAQAWQDGGGSAVFLAADLPDTLRGRLDAEHVDIVPVIGEPGSAADAEHMAALARKAGAAWVVVDGYQFKGAYQRRLREAGLKVLTVDDNGEVEHYCADLVLNQNLHARASLYHEREPHTRLLLGPRFAMLRREFWGWRGWKRDVPPTARKLLVTLGGSDPDKVTGNVLAALNEVNAPGLEVVVIGGSEYAEAARTCRVPMQVRSSVANMPELMAWADVAVAAGGTTTWERALLGLPGLIIVLADNQEKLAAAASRAGIGWNLGRHERLTRARLAEAVEWLIHAGGERADMARRGQELIDGRGGMRVCERMTTTGILLRPVQADDCRRVWEWSNEPPTRAASFSPDPIPWEDHEHWFAAKLDDPRCVFFIALSADETPIGKVFFDLDGREAVISVSLTDRCRGHGYGPQVIREAVTELFAGRPVEVVHAYIRLDNEASRRAFAKAGFAPPEPATVRGQAAHRMSLRRE